MNHELLIDTANLEMIKHILSVFQISGITTNPTILKNEGSNDFWRHLVKIQELLPFGSLHVQVTSFEAEAMLKEAITITQRLGKNTYVKIPVSEQGLIAIKKAVAMGINVTATAIYSSFQGMSAALAGVKYLAVYCNRMDNVGINPFTVINELASFVEGSSCKILAASFHNIKQITEAYTNGAFACTVSPELLLAGINNATISDAIDTFHKDWVSLYGNTSIDKI